jgi:hypothetical protein
MRKTLLLLLSALLIFACSSDDEDTPNMCVDESLINLDVACTAVVEPVCGCEAILIIIAVKLAQTSRLCR